MVQLQGTPLQLALTSQALECIHLVSCALSEALTSNIFRPPHTLPQELGSGANALGAHPRNHVIGDRGCDTNPSQLLCGLWWCQLHVDCRPGERVTLSSASRLYNLRGLALASRVLSFWSWLVLKPAASRTSSSPGTCTLL